MATRITTTKIDDTDGTEATQTVTFGLDDQPYEIDLNDANAARLRDALAPFTRVARRAGGPPPKRRGPVRRLHPDDAREIRLWVRQHKGIVADRGRIPDRYIEAYYAGDWSKAV